MMLHRMVAKAIGTALVLGAITPVAVAGPLGSAPLAETRSPGLTPVAFIYDGQQTLFAAIEGVSYVAQQDDQGNLFFVDPNNEAWLPVFCCTLGQVDTDQGPVLLVNGVLWEPSGVYGAPIVYDGGFNVFFPWTPPE